MHFKPAHATLWISLSVDTVEFSQFFLYVVLYRPDNFINFFYHAYEIYQYPLIGKYFISHEVCAF